MYCRRALIWGLGLMLVGAFLSEVKPGIAFEINFDRTLAFALIGFGVGYLFGLILQELIKRKWI